MVAADTKTINIPEKKKKSAYIECKNNGNLVKNWQFDPKRFAVAPVLYVIYLKKDSL